MGPSSFSWLANKPLLRTSDSGRLTGHGRTHGQRNGAQAEQEPQGLGGAFRADEVDRNGPEHRDEAPVKQPHDEGQDNQRGETLTLK